MAWYNDLFNLRVKRMYKEEGFVRAVDLHRKLHGLGLRESFEAVRICCNHKPYWGKGEL